MRHVGKEIALCLVRRIGSGLLEQEYLGFVFSLLLILLHFFDAAVDLALMHVAQYVECRYERENNKVD